jgi:hypothetical protein
MSEAAQTQKRNSNAKFSPSFSVATPFTSLQGTRVALVAGFIINNRPSCFRLPSSQSIVAGNQILSLEGGEPEHTCTIVHYRLQFIVKVKPLEALAL